MSGLSPKAALVLAELRRCVERIDDWNGEKWGSVYLDNAKPRDMKRRSWAGYLSRLQALGFYRSQDDGFFGLVKMELEAKEE